MIILEIKEYDKKRCEILLDTDERFLLYKGEIKHLKLQKDMEIAEEVYSEIIALLKKRATLRAMNLLQVKDYTEYKLTEKLKESGYPGICIESAIEYVKSYKYVDDYRYASDYVKYQIDKRSERRIKQDLAQKGIDSEIIEEVLDEVRDDNPDAEIGQIKKLLEKKGYSEDMPYKEKQKIMAFLYRKGYSQDLIYKSINI
ncbi:regulatory protein RecX [Butyrivibrio sp. NC3005]|uniref:regulatory protein RecX n=1 Tax=Butyrivibrio sp. NC3005 TaxID=1280685 RepID=UPI0003FF8396|nr:regulatory protein RecX [Butyrivibrio sp. NC3005]